MHRIAPLLVILASLTACGPGAPVGAAPELASIFAFAAYPGAELVDEQVYASSIGPFGRPGTSGFRLYRINGTAEAVRTHYEGLASRHQWFIDNRPGGVADAGYVGPVAALTRDRFSLSASIGDSPSPMGYGGHYGPPAAPSTPPASPAPGPTTRYLRIDAGVRAP